ncbi:MAG: hypothetical protein P9X24_17040 [Candidatus Hatepunaea meridiana]|nr:hypothetical protein [Candidatus Hatepunaea meridiana]
MAAGTYTIDLVGGLVKKLAGAHYNMGMGNGAAITNSNCKAVYSGDVWDWAFPLVEGTRELLFFEPGAWIKFTALITTGQHGCLLVRNGFELEVMTIDGGNPASIARASDVLYCWEDQTQLIAVGKNPVQFDKLYAGDMLDFKEGGHEAQYKITNLCDAWRCFAPGQNDMPGLEEGLNEVNVFGEPEDPNQPPLLRSRIMQPVRRIRQISG